MSRRRKYAAFFSFADVDRALVSELKSLFDVIHVPTYFAPEDLPEAGSPHWKSAIRRAVGESECVVRVFTRNSVRRPWPVYETGVADALDRTVFFARVAALPYSAIKEVTPGKEGYVYNLHDAKQVVNLVLAVCQRYLSGRSYKDSRAGFRAALKASQHLEGVVCRARVRSVFIAGSLPVSGIVSLSVPNSTAKRPAKRIAALTADVTRMLLDAGFTVGSCPEVPDVGAVAAREATRWIAENVQRECERYRIGGLYPIDRSTRESDYSAAQKRHWEHFLADFRRSYLRDYEWLLVIGGNQGTMEEFDAALDIKTLKVCSIPAAGGTGSTIWRKLHELRPFPLTPRSRLWPDRARPKLRDHLLTRRNEWIDGGT